MSGQQDSGPAPLAVDARFRASVERLGAIAAQSGDNLLTEGPVNPDHVLLGVASDALHAMLVARARAEARHQVVDAMLRAGPWTDADRAQDRSMEQGVAVANQAAMQLLRRVGKLRATTPAGIYAKALLVRMAPSGAPKLAASLAEELVECKALRAVLWPSGEGAAL
jgi:hypothetical protein